MKDNQVKKKQPHYFSEKQTSPAKFGYLEIRNLRGRDLKLLTCSGIFNYKKIDRGTWALIENMKLKGEKILDYGCGIGIIGIMYKILVPNAKVVLLDSNPRAVMVAKKNIKLLKLTNIKAVRSTFLEKLKKEKFDNILTAPPISAGMNTCERIFRESYEALKEKGLFQFVTRHKIAGRRLMAFAESLFNNCEVLAKKGGYWVYCCTKNKSLSP